MYGFPVEGWVQRVLSARKAVKWVWRVVQGVLGRYLKRTMWVIGVGGMFVDVVDSVVVVV